MKTKGEGDSPREDPVDFLGDEESKAMSCFGEERVRSVEPSEEGVKEFLLPLTSSHSPSLESLESPVNGMDLIWLALCKNKHEICNMEFNMYPS